MSKFARILLLSIPVVLAAGIARATIPAVCVVDVNVPSGGPVSLVVLPDASGPSFAEAMVFGGAVADGTISFRLVQEATTIPIPNFPFEDVWLETGGVVFGWCDLPYPHRADANSDASGKMEFALTPHGAGHAEEVLLYLNGSPAMDPFFNVLPPLPIRLNSPDLDADRKVNLSDVMLFAGDYFGAYAYRSDLHWDGRLNLSDIVKMAAGLGHDCP